MGYQEYIYSVNKNEAIDKFKEDIRKYLTIEVERKCDLFLFKIDSAQGIEKNYFLISGERGEGGLLIDEIDKILGQKDNSIPVEFLYERNISDEYNDIKKFLFLCKEGKSTMEKWNYMSEEEFEKTLDEHTLNKQLELIKELKELSFAERVSGDIFSKDKYRIYATKLDSIWDNVLSAHMNSRDAKYSKVTKKEWLDVRDWLVRAKEYTYSFPHLSLV